MYPAAQCIHVTPPGWHCVRKATAADDVQPPCSKQLTTKAGVHVEPHRRLCCFTALSFGDVHCGSVRPTLSEAMYAVHCTVQPCSSAFLSLGQRVTHSDTICIPMGLLIWAEATLPTAQRAPADLTKHD